MRADGNAGGGQIPALLQNVYIYAGTVEIPGGGWYNIS